MKALPHWDEKGMMMIAPSHLRTNSVALYRKTTIGVAISKSNPLSARIRFAPPVTMFLVISPNYRSLLRSSRSGAHLTACFPWFLRQDLHRGDRLNHEIVCPPCQLGRIHHHELFRLSLNSVFVASILEKPSSVFNTFIKEAKKRVYKFSAHNVLL